MEPPKEKEQVEVAQEVLDSIFGKEDDDEEEDEENEEEENEGEDEPSEEAPPDDEA